MLSYAQIGMEREEIDTPALLIDIDALEKNIKTMADYYRSKNGVLRPHQKGHRLPIIAKKQLDAGAKGVSMTSFGLAEYYVQRGIDDILITSEISGRNKIRRMATLSKHADVTVAVDDVNNVKQLSETALANNTRINVAVELFMGDESCGVEMDDAKDFVKDIIRFKGIRFKGLWWHQSQPLPHGWEARKKKHFSTLDRVAVLKDEIEDSGINVEMLSAGYTFTWNITPEHTNLKNVEVQAGSYVFSDWASHEVEGLEAFDYALTVLTRCISRPKPTHALFDFGLNSCSAEHSDDYSKIVGPRFKDLNGVINVVQREELGWALFEKPNKDVKVGDVFELIPPHSDTTAKLYDKYYCIRNNKVEAIWRNYGRGLF